MMLLMSNSRSCSLSLIFTLLLFLAGCTSFTSASDISSENIFDQECPDSYQVDDSSRQEVIFSRKPVLEKYWIEKPNITHCSKSGVSEGRLRSAILFWENQGYEFGKVSVNVDSFACFGEPLNGEIMITIITNEIAVGSNLPLHLEQILLIIEYTVMLF